MYFIKKLSRYKSIDLFINKRKKINNANIFEMSGYLSLKVKSDHDPKFFFGLRFGDWEIEIDFADRRHISDRWLEKAKLKVAEAISVMEKVNIPEYVEEYRTSLTACKFGLRTIGTLLKYGNY